MAVARFHPYSAASTIAPTILNILARRKKEALDQEATAFQREIARREAAAREAQIAVARGNLDFESGKYQDAQSRQAALDELMFGPGGLAGRRNQRATPGAGGLTMAPDEPIGPELTPRLPADISMMPGDQGRRPNVSLGGMSMFPQGPPPPDSGMPMPAPITPPTPPAAAAPPGPGAAARPPAADDRPLMFQSPAGPPAGGLSRPTGLPPSLMRPGSAAPTPPPAGGLTRPVGAGVDFGLGEVPLGIGPMGVGLGEQSTVNTSPGMPPPTAPGAAGAMTGISLIPKGARGAAPGAAGSAPAPGGGATSAAAAGQMGAALVGGAGIWDQLPNHVKQNIMLRMMGVEGVSVPKPDSDEPPSDYERQLARYAKRLGKKVEDLTQAEEDAFAIPRANRGDNEKDPLVAKIQEARLELLERSARGDLSPQARLQYTRQLRNDFIRETSAARTVTQQLALMRESMANVRAAHATGKGNAGPASEAAIVTFNKILDPISVVLASEFMRSGQGAPLYDALRARWEKIKQGGQNVSVGQLEEYLALAERFASAQQKYAQESRSQINEIAVSSGLNPALITREYNADDLSDAVPGATVSSPNPTTGATAPGLPPAPTGQRFLKEKVRP